MKITATIQQNRLSPTWKTHREHVAYVKNLHNPPTTPPARACPKCGAEMVIRTAKRGDNAGNQFWGCSKFPQCRQMIPLENG